jgi:hypothetical protein
MSIGVLVSRCLVLFCLEKAPTLQPAPGGISIAQRCGDRTPGSSGRLFKTAQVTIDHLRGPARLAVQWAEEARKASETD